ncbi:MAG: T9SS type A sorting domain-containing protein, partial [Bacteroidota bacterium]
HNWYDCNPNPDACQPQNGTWYYNRAGWCPGAIAQWYDYNMTPYVAGHNVELKYVFYENYVDLCHPNNPSCVTGVTCTDCSDGFNPFLDVACNLVVFSNNPVLTGKFDGHSTQYGFSVRPNPASTSVEIYAYGSPAGQSEPIRMLTITGTQVDQYPWDGKSVKIDISHYSRGLYIVKIPTPDGWEMKKLLIN